MHGYTVCLVIVSWCDGWRMLLIFSKGRRIGLWQVRFDLGSLSRRNDDEDEQGRGGGLGANMWTNLTIMSALPSRDWNLVKSVCRSSLSARFARTDTIVSNLTSHLSHYVPSTLQLRSTY